VALLGEGTLGCFTLRAPDAVFIFATVAFFRDSGQSSGLFG
jgi:hypothetical protein